MSFKLFVPPLGTRLLLTEDWSFQLYNERRNATLMAMLGDTRKISYSPESIPASLPAGTVLIIDRYYIKQGLGSFDSVSFRIENAKATATIYSFAGANTRQVRFWAKLDEVNRLMVDLAPPLPAKTPRKRA